MLQKIGKFVKDEIVLCVAGLLAIVSMFVVPPSEQYIEYIDFRVLALLFCLMLVVAGLSNAGVFEWLMNVLMRIVHNTRQLTIVLVMACFFLSMWITNDVALITLVPFAIMVLRAVYKDAATKKLLSVTAYVVVLQTVAANLGSMCTPIGNPQNLYLYTSSGMSIIEFLGIMWPYTLVSLVLVIIACLFVKSESITGVADAANDGDMDGRINMDNADSNAGKAKPARIKKSSGWRIPVYAVLFIVSILTVLGIVHYLVMLAIVVVTVAIVEPKLFKNADYMLLITFVAFFVFVGNLKNIEFFNNLFGVWVQGNSILVSVLASQVISNVPAAVLLSGFTADSAGLMIGTNIGGLGTIIASMASLISYKFFAKIEGSNKGAYMGMFTLINVLFLAVLMLTVATLHGWFTIG
ncbi:MAG: citrate transporter [Lachnospira sp.]|nr:citrate transporter [Lachnospira sp.]